MDTKELIRVYVRLKEIHSVETEEATITMILFDGEFECELGKGVVLPGGVDTQKHMKGEPKTLSARYILEGCDKQGKTFHIFVENNGVDDGSPVFYTTPAITTDAAELKWMEKEPLMGTVEGDGDMRVLIKIYRNN